MTFFRRLYVGLVFAFALLAGAFATPQHVYAAPKCDYIGASGDYIDALRAKAEAASERGDHRTSASWWAKAGDYTYDCVPGAVQDYLDGKPAPELVDVPHVKTTLYGQAAFMYENAATEARVARVSPCAYAQRAIEAWSRAPEVSKRDVEVLRRKLLRGC